MPWNILQRAGISYDAAVNRRFPIICKLKKGRPMKKLTVLAFAILLGSSIGCGGQGVSPSAATPPKTPEQDMETIEKAAESGTIDPKTYGKQ